MIKQDLPTIRQHKASTKDLIHSQDLGTFLEEEDQINRWRKNFSQTFKIFSVISEKQPQEVKKGLIFIFRWMLISWMP